MLIVVYMNWGEGGETSLTPLEEGREHRYVTGVQKKKVYKYPPPLILY